MYAVSAWNQSDRASRKVKKLRAVIEVSNNIEHRARYYGASDHEDVKSTPQGFRAE
jgi:hypothetical protein